MSKAIDWVAEHIMNYERGVCRGEIGGGSATCKPDGTVESDSWFYCDWCGQKVDWDDLQPCSHYPVQRFGILDLMYVLGEKHDIHSIVRFDPGRGKNKFTVLAKGSRVGDTDEPLVCLCKFAKRELEK